jgi:hypothetical protein
MFQAAQTAGTSPFLITRVAAIVHTRCSTPSMASSAGIPGARDARCTARRVPARRGSTGGVYHAVNLYPSEKPNFDQQLASSLASIGSGAAAETSVSISAPALFALSTDGKGQGAIWDAITGKVASPNAPPPEDPLHVHYRAS